MRTLLPMVFVFALLAGCGGSKSNPGLADAIVQDGADADLVSVDTAIPEDVPGRDLEPDVPGADDTPAADPPQADAVEDAAGDAPEDPGPADAIVADQPVDPGTVDPGPQPADYPPSGRGFYETQQTPGSVVRGSRTTAVVAHGPRRIDGKPSPLVVFLPGFQAPTDLYKETVDHLASHGFVVVRASPPGGLFDVNHVEMAKDAMAVIDWAVDPTGPLGGRVDGSWVGVMGHSLGGKLATMVAFQDSRVKALFAIDPVNGGNPFTGYSATLPDIVPDDVATLAIPVGFPGETFSADHSSLGQSCAPADQNYTTFYSAAAAAPWKAKWEFAGADHMDFVDDLSACGTVCSVCPEGTGDPLKQVAALRTLMTAFFRRHHGGETAMEDWLFGAKTPAEAAATHAP